MIDDAEPLRVSIPKRTGGFAGWGDILIDQVRAIGNRRLYRAYSARLIKCIAPSLLELMNGVTRSLSLSLDMS